MRPSPEELDASLTCEGDFTSGPTPVLLVPGTTATLDSHYGSNIAPALTQQGIPWCGVTVPQKSLGDLTIAGEYDVHAIRTVYERAGRKIVVFGHSQGGSRPRWALRFFPDTREMVEELVGVAPANQGIFTSFADETRSMCAVSGCPQGIWQQAASQFVAALNSIQETFVGIDYTVIYSETDGLIQPDETILHAEAGTAYSRAAIQDLCPTRNPEHTTLGSIDGVMFAMFMDALEHDGPLDLGRMDTGACDELFVPGYSPVESGSDTASGYVQIGTAFAEATYDPAEADLPCYVWADCPVAVDSSVDGEVNDGPLPATGGGLSLLAMMLLGAALASRRATAGSGPPHPVRGAPRSLTSTSTAPSGTCSTGK